jgi:vesicle-associated membrane protein 4
MAPQMKQVEKQNAPTGEVQQQVDEVIGIMHTNIEKVVQRGEKLDTLQNKTEELQNGALSFKKTSTDIKNEMWWKNIKLTLAVVGIVTTVCVIIGVTVARNYQ